MIQHRRPHLIRKQRDAANEAQPRQTPSWKLLFRAPLERQLRIKAEMQRVPREPPAMMSLSGPGTSGGLWTGLGATSHNVYDDLPIEPALGKPSGEPVRVGYWDIPAESEVAGEADLAGYDGIPAESEVAGEADLAGYDGIPAESEIAGEAARSGYDDLFADMGLLELASAAPEGGYGPSEAIAAAAADPVMLAELRQKAHASVAEEAMADKRVPLSKAELEAEGWALLPLLRAYQISDGENRVTYHTGAQRDGNLIELRGDGLFYFADPSIAGPRHFPEKPSQAAAPADSVHNVERTIIGWNYHCLKAMAEMLREQGRNALATKVLEDDPARYPRAKLLINIMGIENTRRWNELRKVGLPAGRFIFAMNEAGRFFAGRAIDKVVHHSSFLAGGAVAAAGEMELDGGKLKCISNASGHYRPGPAYLWQAVEQLGSQMDVSGVRVEILGAGDMQGDAFLAAFGAADFTFDAAKDLEMVRRFLEHKARPDTGGPGTNTADQGPARRIGIAID